MTTARPVPRAMTAARRSNMRKLAALSALVLFAPELPYPAQILYKLGTGAAVVWAAFSFRGIRRFLCAVFWYATLNLLLAGLALLVITQTGAPGNSLPIFSEYSRATLESVTTKTCAPRRYSDAASAAPAPHRTVLGRDLV